MNGTLIAQIVTSGLVSGLIYMLIALGVTLLFGIMRVVNFVHGELVMLSAFAVYFLGSEAGLPFFLALPAAIVISAVLVVFCQYALFKPLQRPDASTFTVRVAGVAPAEFEESVTQFAELDAEISFAELSLAANESVCCGNGEPPL